ncbi:MAG: hypothetical protein AAGC63_16660, partial [Propionicimonas sp.]|nr:hypothetical protein [Propionicimonas sp.]
VDTLAPVPRLRAGGSVAGMVGRGVRPGAVATIAEAARLAASDPRSAGRSEPDKQWHPVDAATLEGYLAGVEAAASRAESG